MAKTLLPVLALREEGRDPDLSWFQEVWRHLAGELGASYEIKYINSKSEAEQLLAAGTVRAAIAHDTDAASAVKSSGFLQQGGCIIFCSPMPGNTSPPKFKDCFTELGLPWAMSDYYRADFYPGAAAGKLGLPNCNYNAKAVTLNNVAAADIVYGPTEQSYTQSMVFPTRCVGDPNAAAVAFSATGAGAVGYVGDVNDEEESAAIVLAMLSWAESRRL